MSVEALKEDELINRSKNLSSKDLKDMVLRAFDIQNSRFKISKTKFNAHISEEEMLTVY